jgi:hypothetical protein
VTNAYFPAPNLKWLTKKFLPFNLHGIMGRYLLKCSNRCSIFQGIHRNLCASKRGDAKRWGGLEILKSTCNGSKYILSVQSYLLLLPNESPTSHVILEAVGAFV